MIFNWVCYSTIPKFDGRPGNICENVVYFHCHNPDLFLKEFSKSLTDHAYTWYMNLKPGTVHDWEDLVSFFNTKFCCAKSQVYVG